MLFSGLAFAKQFALMVGLCQPAGVGSWGLGSVEEEAERI